MRPVKINVSRPDYMRYIEIVPETETEGGQVSIGYFDGRTWTFEPIGSGELPDGLASKFLRIPASWGRPLLEELVKIYGHPEKDATTQKLEATQYHLEDMRKLVFDSRVK